MDFGHMLQFMHVWMTRMNPLTHYENKSCASKTHGGAYYNVLMNYSIDFLSFVYYMSWGIHMCYVYDFIVKTN